MSKMVYKSNANKIILGVCGGIAEYYGFNAGVLRILFLIFSPITFWLYIVLIIRMPSNNLL
ncbi:PspC domain-containing protein [Clostridium nigeriense]|uniref:PspC domain-containing protein n=1 Tax=Clostridium nigeriense TaxID=1805470 RepID=UPI003D34C02F